MQSNFVPHARHNAQSMVDGTTYMGNLAELAAFMDDGGSIDHPLNEVAFGTTRLFLELDGALSDDLEDTLFNLLLRRGYADDADAGYKAVLRSGHVDGPRYHVVYPNVVMPVHEYRDLIKILQAEYPQVDLTANESKAWLRFPKAPKVGTNRRYHLVQGTYRDAFINPHDTPAPGTRITLTGLVGGRDEHRIFTAFNFRVKKRGYVQGGKRTYFSKGPAICVHGTVHRKRPVTVHVTDDKVWLGACKDPTCLRGSAAS